MRLAVPLATVALAAVLVAGCGSSSEQSSPTGPAVPPPAGGSGAPEGAAALSCETDAVDARALRATGVSCRDARQVLHGWQRDDRCAAGAGASRSACTTGSYRCLAARADRGLAVSCSRPGHSIAFVARRR